MKPIKSLYGPITQSALLAFFTAGCVSYLPQAVAQYQSDGSELGASISISQSNPLEAVVTIRPLVAFQRVIVEVVNGTGGSKIQCRIDNIIEQKIYSCPVSGIADSGNSALVVSVNGIFGTGSQLAGKIVQKKFSVPNPNYDQEGARKKQDQAERETRLELTRPSPPR